jgi:hypothetical protein
VNGSATAQPSRPADDRTSQTTRPPSTACCTSTGPPLNEKPDGHSGAGSVSPIALSEPSFAIRNPFFEPCGVM